MAAAASHGRLATVLGRGYGTVSDRWRIPRLPALRGRSLAPEVLRGNLASRSCYGSEIDRDSSFDEGERFVGWFREVWPYIRGHRGSTFVVVIAGEIVASPCLDDVLQDISLLHGLGIKFVLIPRANIKIDELLAERGKKGKYIGCYRVTDGDSLEAAMEAAGMIQVKLEAKLSPGPPILNLRRHGSINRWHEVGSFVASGNVVAAKRRGVVDGIDYGLTGEVKKIDVPRIRERLEKDSIVIVSDDVQLYKQRKIREKNMIDLMPVAASALLLEFFSTYEVATACALVLEADKLICITDGQIVDEKGCPIRFISIQEEDFMVKNKPKQNQTAANHVKVVGSENYIHPFNFESVGSGKQAMATEAFSLGNNANAQNVVGVDNCSASWSIGQGFAIGGEERMSTPYFAELAAVAFVCKRGVQRVHIVDGTCGGALLLDLFTRDGRGTMIAGNVYEGTRMARDMDLPGIKKVISPLEESGTLILRSEEQLRNELDSFVVVERDGSVIACAALFPFLEEKCGEVASFAVSAECRGQGQGDKLLDLRLEEAPTSAEEERAQVKELQPAESCDCCGLDRFVRRGFYECSVEAIPEERRKRIDFSRGSKYYMKKLQAEMGGITMNHFAFGI
ncbi:hypothetical protein IEQ34_021660 [Dendrobium chrysotoxum]|uniref:N-acetyltransferase domain-containing protein n=1 Tax=Dendrobium chrysotoxum TaxID=161865 RepID=A0AAV7G5H4_DENCH|nr:hypothetical protein IEQ34_021660 [Dendrobium chrysotoxum]